MADQSVIDATKAYLNAYVAFGLTSPLQVPNMPNDREGTITRYLHDVSKYDAYWYHSDHLGSSSYISNKYGYVSQYMEYLPFGETLVDEHLNSYNTPYKFNSKELDEETGNYYYGARYYNPKWSIWLSVDPLTEKFYDVSPYAYTLNNPINYIDPDGRDVIGATGKDSDKVVNDIKTTFADKRFSDFRNLIKRKKGFLGIGKSKKLAKIDQAVFDKASSNLKDDDLAAVTSVFNSINSENEMVFEFISSASQKLSSKGNSNYAKALVTEYGDFGQESQTFKGNDIKLAGKEGLTVKSKKGIHAFINDGTGVNHPNGKRAVTTFHEGFGHGLSILNGLKGKANDDNTIRYDNMIRRVMGFSNFRDGTKHGGLTPVVSPNILPAYR